MATLKAHGYEIARVTFPEVALNDESKTQDSLSYRSDGRILRKVVFKGDLWKNSGFTWKLFRRFNLAISKDEAALRAAVQKRCDAYRAAGATVTGA